MKQNIIKLFYLSVLITLIAQHYIVCDYVALAASNQDTIRGGIISGRVLTEKSYPIEDVCVELYFGQHKIKTGVTDKNGEYSIYGLPTQEYGIKTNVSCQKTRNFIDQWFVSDQKSENNSKKNPLYFKISSKEHKKDMNFYLKEGGIISGRVTTLTNDPIEKICVVITGPCKETWYGGALTQDDGSYLIVGLETGDYFAHINIECSDIKKHFETTWFDNQTDCKKATPVHVLAGQSVLNINFSLKEQGTISGKVVDTNGNPIPKVCVYAGRQPCKKTGQAFGQTDENGYYFIGGLAQASYYLSTFASCDVSQKFIDQWWTSEKGNDNCQKAEPVVLNNSNSNSKENIDFILASAGMITGTISTNDGKPISNACIYASSYCSNSFRYEGQTDESGKYSLILPSGQYYLKSLASCTSSMMYVDLWWNKKGGDLICTNSIPVYIKEGLTEKNIDFALEKGGVVSGKVTTTDLQPINDIQILLTDMCAKNVFAKTTTQLNGTYTMTVPEGSYFITTKTSDKNFLNEWWKKDDWTNICSKAEPIRITKNQITSDINFSLIEGGYITGVVTYQRAYPKVGGAYEKRIKPAIKNKFFMADSLRISYAPPTFGYAYQKTPSQNISVVAVSYERQYRYRTQTNQDGFYRMVVPEGQYYVFTEIENLNYVNQWYLDSLSKKEAVLVPIKTGETTKDINFDLQSGGIVTGIIKDNEKHPIAGICVIAKQNDAKIRFASSRTDAKGVYRIQGLPEGEFDIIPDASCNKDQFYIDRWTGGGPIAKSISVEPDTTVTGVDFQLHQGGTITGRVMSTDGKALKKIWLDATSKCGEFWFGGAWSDRDGIYSITGLQQGKYFVHTNVNMSEQETGFTDKWWTPDSGTSDCNQAKPIIVKTGKPTKDINIELGINVSVTGAVLSKDNIQIPGVFVYATTFCGEVRYGNSISDAYGKYTITDLPAGEYVLFADTGDSDQKFIGEWWTSAGGSVNCEEATTITMGQEKLTDTFDFHLEKSQITRTFDDKEIPPLQDGEYIKYAETGKGYIKIKIRNMLLDVDINAMPLDEVLKFLSQKTGLKILINGTSDQQISFSIQNASLDSILLELIKGKAGHIFIYSPNRLLTSYIFLKDGKVHPKTIWSSSGSPQAPETINSQGAFSPEGYQPPPQLTEEEITALMQSPGQVELKIRELARLIEYDKPYALNTIKTALDDQDEEVRLMAVSTAVDLKNNQDTVEVLSKAMLSDNSAAVRAISAEALGQIGDKRAISALHQAMSDTDKGVHETAKRALQELNGGL